MNSEVFTDYDNSRDLLGLRDRVKYYREVTSLTS